MVKSLLRRMSRRRTPAAEADDPWAGDGTSYYVYNFREHLDVIAKALSLKALKGHVMCTRLNVDEGCAELHYSGGDVIAQVTVHGDTGTPNKAVVTPFCLPESARALFTLILPVRVEFKTIEKVAA